MISKTCKWCKQLKNLEYFNKHFKMPDGHLNKCKTCEKEYKKQYYKNNKPVKQKWDQEHKEQRNTYKRSKAYKEVRNKSRNERYKNDLQYKILHNLRCRLRTALKKNQKKSKTVDYLGCSIQFLKIYLESKFEVDMNWENWNHKTWHIDHIRPLSSFDLTKENEIKKACHYTNLQPLWAIDNLYKSNKYGFSS